MANQREVRMATRHIELERELAELQRVARQVHEHASTGRASIWLIGPTHAFGRHVMLFELTECAAGALSYRTSDTAQWSNGSQVRVVTLSQIHRLAGSQPTLVWCHGRFRGTDADAVLWLDAYCHSRELILYQTGT